MKQRLTALFSAVLIVGLIFSMSYTHEVEATVPGVNQLVSQGATGTWANNESRLGLHSVSGDGNFVTFTSSATNLVANDTNGMDDIFVKNLSTGAITLVDVSNTGTQASNGASEPSISYDGRYVVFVSTSDLVSGVTGASVYRRDLINNTTSVVSIDSSGTTGQGSAPDINADGRYVTFITTDSSLTGKPSNSTNTHKQVVIKDLLTGTIQPLSGPSNWLGDGDSLFPSIDCDGHVVTFLSGARLSSDTPTNHDYHYNIYNVYYSTVDWDNNPLTYVNSVSSYGLTRPQISCNGNSISYTKYGSNLRVSSYNRLTKQSTDVAVSTAGTMNNQGVGNGIASLSDDGRYIAFVSKATNLDSSKAFTYKSTNYDVFVRDMKNNTTQLVSFTALGNYSGLVPSGGNFYPPQVSISPDGSNVAYTYQTPDATSATSELISGIHTGVTDIYISKTGF